MESAVEKDMSTSAKEETMTGRRLPLLLLTATVLATISTLVWMGWNSYYTYKDHRSFSRYHAQVATLKGALLHLDEVLSMSVRMGVMTGEPQWRERYEHFKPQLERAVQHALALTSPGSGKSVPGPQGQSGQRLSELEQQLLRLAADGRAEQAKVILLSESFERDRRLAAQQINTLATRLEVLSDSRLQSERKRSLIHLTVAVLACPLLAVAWLGTAHSLRRDMHKGERIKKSLQEARDDLERRVDEQLNEILNISRSLQREVEQRDRAETRLEFDALHDVLTGLPNRELLLQRIDDCITRVKQSHEFQFAILFLDVDDFKVINDSLGHKAGDEMLLELSRRLASSVRSMDVAARPSAYTTARIGGDEFVILLDGLEKSQNANTIAHRIQMALNHPFNIEGREIVVTSSIGICSSHSAYDHPDEMLRDADTALAHAKDQGKARQEIFRNELRTRAVTRLEIETELRKAIERRELFLQYQPIVRLDSTELAGFEALLRWQHPQQGFIPPDRFITIAEQTSLIIPLGAWVLEEACRQAMHWRNSFPDAASLSMAVNLSGKQFLHNNLTEQIDQIMDRTGMDPRYLTLEITESLIMENTEGLNEIRSRNIELHMDDFGTGYSSLAQIHLMPVSAIKLDRSFIRHVNDDHHHAATIEAIVTLAHTRGMKLVAEGIETAEQLANLQSLKCDYGQGYYFSPPLTNDHAERLILNGCDWSHTV